MEQLLTAKDELLIKTIADNTRVIMAMHQVLLDAQSDYCFTVDACRILGIKNERDLKWLRDQGHLPNGFSKRGRHFIYKKRLLYVLADKIDRGLINIPKR